MFRVTLKNAPEPIDRLNVLRRTLRGLLTYLRVTTGRLRTDTRCKVQLSGLAGQL